MAAYTVSGYSLADIAALKAVASGDRPASGSGIYALAYVNAIGWLNFDPDASTGGITPNSGTGRWFVVGREVLRANRIYYVRNDGSDSNNGLANNSGGAFLTWAKCQDVLATLDGNGFSATVQFTGTFTARVNIDKQFVGFSLIQIDGNTTTPSNAFINTTNESVYIATNTPVYIKGLKLASSANIGLWVASGFCEINGNLEFAACGFSHIYVSGQKAQLNQKSGYLISGASPTHFQSYDQGLFDANGSGYTVTITGSPNFSSAFALLGRAGTALFVNITYSGTTTGKQYDVLPLSGLFAIGTTFAGSIAGTVDAKGYYGT